MHTFLLPLFRAVLVASWQGSIALVLVLLVRQATGARISARWRYLLWMLVLVRLLVPAFVLPRHAASLENIRAVAPPFERSIEANLTASRPVFSQNATPPEPSSVVIPRRWLPWEWAAVAWLAGASALGLWFAGSAVQMHGRLRRKVFEVNADTRALWQACCERLHLSRPPRLLAADWIASPALVGLVCPALLIPRTSEQSFSARDWEHVFAHEIAHLRCRDHWGQLLQLVALCAHWFNPVVWFGFRRLRTDRELAADEWALRRLGSGRALAYGETLLKALAGTTARGAFQPGMVGITEDGAQIKQRLVRIVSYLPRRRVLGSVLGGIVALVLGTVVLGQKAAEPPARPASEPVTRLVASAQGVIDDILVAARAGDASRVHDLLAASIERGPQLGQDSAGRMLDDLVRRRELAGFTTLRDELKKTNLGKDWKISDELLSALVKEDRRDFLEALLARDLALDRLSQEAKSADRPTAEWIAHRVAEVAKRRADIEALGKAASDGDLPAMRRLIDAGVDVNAVDKANNTMLIETVHKDRLEAAQLLLDHGADANKARFPGWDYTPLCLVHSVPMAEVLRRAGGDVHARLFGRNVSILTYVARWSKPEVVAWFLDQGLDPKMIGDNDQTLLFDLQDVRTAELLLDKGVDPNRPDEFGQTPICTARSVEVAQKLIDRGAKLTGLKDPLLPRMIQFGSPGAIEAVLKAQAGPDHQELQRALLGACFINKAEIARVLLKYGANPNEPTLWHDGDAQTILPLTACTINPSARTAQVLLDAGADPNAGKFPGEILRNAVNNGHKDVAEVLRKAGARGVADLEYYVSVGNEEKIRELLASAPKYSDDPTLWDGVLIEAVRVGDLRTVRAATDHGMPVGKDANAIREAASAGRPEILSALLEQRTKEDDPEPLDNALWEAAYKSNAYRETPPATAYEKCVEVLLKTGTPFKASGVDNFMTAAVFTERPGGNLKVIEMLAQAGLDPNPSMRSEGHPQGHLLDGIQEAVARGERAPTAEVIVAINQLVANAAAKGGAPASAASTEQPVFLSTVRVRASDGLPLDPPPVMVYDHVPHPGGFLTGAARVEGKDGAPLWIFQDATEVSYVAVKRGYAPAFAGPFRPPLEAQLKNIPITLSRGTAGSVQIVDEGGQPIAGAKLEGFYPGPPLIDHEKASDLETTTDAGGAGAFEHVGAAPFNVRVTAPGYQDGEVTGIRFDPAKPYRWTLRKAQPVAGAITAQATGQPIVGAKIKLAAVRGPDAEDHEDPSTAPTVATTDERGRFTLPNLRADSTYFLFVEAAGYGPVVLESVHVGSAELAVALGPELYVRGRFIHAAPQQKVRVSSMQMIRVGQGSYGTERPSEIEAHGGEGTFAIGPLYRAPLTLRIGTWRTKIQPDDLPKSDVVVDLSGN